MFTRADARWLSDTVAALYAAQTPLELARPMATLTQSHFRSMVGGGEEIALDFSYYIPHAVHFAVRMPDDAAVCIHDHPAWSRLRHGTQTQFCQLTKCAASSVDRTDFFNGFCRPLGIRDQLVTLAKTDTDVFVVCCCRDSRFTATERELLLLMHPHLLAAWHRVRRLRESRGSLRLDLEPNLRLIQINLAVQRILHAYFPGWRASDASLPARLAEWVQSSLSALRDPSPHRPLRAFIVESACGRLFARCFPCADGTRTQIVFIETPAEPNYHELRACGLTSRECEVVHWLSAGKRDAEIAAILGVAAKTVSKHVENALRKFGAETRGVAVRTAREWLGRA
jgi:DNA-binding CsgD family transcriptional regulator